MAKTAHNVTLARQNPSKCLRSTRDCKAANTIPKIKTTSTRIQKIFGSSYGSLMTKALKSDSAAIRKNIKSQYLMTCSR